MNATVATLYMVLIANELVSAPLGGRGSGEVYAVLMSRVDLTTYNKLITVGQKSGLWTETPGHWLEVTEKGRFLVERAENIVKAQQALED